MFMWAGAVVWYMCACEMQFFKDVNVYNKHKQFWFMNESAVALAKKIDFKAPFSFNWFEWNGVHSIKA